jgi:hypothetical protein
MNKETMEAESSNYNEAKSLIKETDNIEELK